eukprot:TRINITY_DN15311_c0_g1_i1.p1 TRINITY_DN15311_c0_g1~~TRINITY_DN15311_c0_g1_i1.p1  ORF type:complete len:442 (-),score=108.53 TRINITY_DN15311_c0_g1_i1:179-1504(-)
MSGYDSAFPEESSSGDESSMVPRTTGMMHELKAFYIIATGGGASVTDFEYDPRSWTETLFTIRGSVVPEIIQPLTICVIYSYVAYAVQCHLHYELDFREGPKFFSALSIFFMIFRLQSAHKRYLEGRRHTGKCMDLIRSMIGKTISYLGKAKKVADEQKEKVEQSKVDMLRLSLLTGILLKLQNRLGRHSSLDQALAKCVLLDISRIRGLLYEKEYEYLRGLVGVSEDTIETIRETCACSLSFEGSGKVRIQLTVYAIHRLRDLIGDLVLTLKAFPERVLNAFESDLCGLQDVYTSMCMKAEVPDPVNYVQLARLTLITFVMLFPWQIDYREGILINVFFPSIISLIFLGIDIISTNFEDPHGDDISDVKILTPLHEVEKEMMMQLDIADDPARHYFAWRSVPADDGWLRPRNVKSYLCLVSERKAAEALERNARSGAWIH